MKFHYISLGNLNFGRGLHNRDVMLLESLANQSMRAWKLNWFAVTSRACCPPLQRLQSHLPSHLAKPSDTVSTSFQNGSRNQRSTRHVRHLRWVLEMLHYDPTSGTFSNASGSSLGQWKVITSHWQISWRSGLPNSPTKMISGIMLVVFPQPFVQISLWRCNLKRIDWLAVPGGWVPNPPNADGGSGFGQLKAFWPNPRDQHLLGRNPLNSVGW